MSYYVYVILSQKNNKQFTYVGYTKNLINRLDLHNKGKGAKFTRGRKWKLIYHKKYSTKNKAMVEEYKLKNNNQFRKELKKINENINPSSI